MNQHIRKRYETCTTEAEMNTNAEGNRPEKDPDTWALVAVLGHTRWTYFYWQREIGSTEGEE